MNEVQIFENEEFGSVRTVEINGKPYFVANDVARALGYKRPADAVTAHCKGSVKHRYLTDGGEQELKVIPEGDVYRLIVRSKLPSAERFESWVFDEVLPSIRKTGMYNIRDSYLIEDPAERARRWAEEYEEKKALMVQVEEQRPKVEFANHVSDSSNYIDVGTMAKLLNENGINVGRNRLFQFLRDRKVLMKNNVPYQSYIDRGYFVVKECTVAIKGDNYMVRATTYITGEGQQFIFDLVSKSDEFTRCLNIGVYHRTDVEKTIMERKE